MLSKNVTYPAKILLFGEYTIITGSNGLAIPFRDLRASFAKEEDAESVASTFKLDNFYHYLKGSKILSESIDLGRFGSDIEKGFYLNSNIPRGYGIGSSGALCAAVYAHYATNFERKESYSSDELNHLRDIMALMENFYHGTSSGLDCLVSLIDKSVFVEKFHKYSAVNMPELSELGNFYLYDSGLSRKTASFVYGFLQKYEADEKYKKNIDEHTALVNSLIDDLLLKNKKSFHDNMVELSHFQYLHFSDMIPENVKEIWMRGLKTNQYYFKLCGAGGGGYFLVYSAEGSFESQKDFIAIN